MGGWGGGNLRIVKCGRELLLTATAALTELTRIIYLPNIRKQITPQVAAKLLVTSKQSEK